METEVSVKYYIGLDMLDGSHLYLNYGQHPKSWTPYRGQATSWDWESGIVTSFNEQVNLNNIPSNARIVKIKTTVEETKWTGKE